MKVFGNVILGLTLVLTQSDAVFAVENPDPTEVVTDAIKVIFGDTSGQAVTVRYKHTAETESECEQGALERAIKSAKGECAKKTGQTCKEVGEGRIVDEADLVSAPATQPVHFRQETNNEASCETEAKAMARDAALSSCRGKFGECRLVSEPIITRPVSKNAAYTSGGMGGMFKKYNCTASAHAEPLTVAQNRYECEAEATAKPESKIKLPIKFPKNPFGI